MAFTSWSLSDEELEDLDPWLKKILGNAGEGSEWTIERQKDGSVQAMLIGKDGTARSRKTLPSTVAPTEPEKFGPKLPEVLCLGIVVKPATTSHVPAVAP